MAGWNAALEKLETSLIRRPWLAWGAVAALLAVQVSDAWHPTPDACSYLSIGRSLADGHAANLGNSHLMYAPGYPLLVSPLFLAGERPFLLLAVWQWAVAVAAMLGIYRWAHRVVPEAALWITLLSLVNAALWAQYRRTLSDLVFTCVLFWTLHFLHEAAAAGPWRRTVLWGLLAAVGCALLPLIRPAGITLVAGTAVALFLAAREGITAWRRACGLSLAAALPALLVLLAFLAYERMTTVETGEKTNLDWFAEMAGQLVSSRFEGLRLCVASIGRVTIPGMFKSYGRPGNWLDINMAIYVPFVVLVFCGWSRLGRGSCDPLVWMFPFYFLLHALWGIDQGERYFVPLVPLQFAALACALGSKPHWLRGVTGWRPVLGLPGGGELRRRATAVALAAHLAIALGHWLASDLPRAYALKRAWPEIDRLAAEIKLAPGTIAARDWPIDKRLMLQLALDREVVPLEDGEPLEPETLWLIAPLSAELPAGFERHQAMNEWQLLRRWQLSQALAPTTGRK